MIRLFHSYILIGMISMFTACSVKEGLCDKPRMTFDKKSSPKPEWITVWIHGTQPCLETPATTGMKATIKRVAETYYYCKLGLLPIKEHSPKNRHYILAELLIKEDPINFPEPNFYTFGWSGKLCFKARKDAADKLYQELLSLIEQETEKTGVRPRLRLITHSHGGNVALNLAIAEKKYQKHLIIDELVLLACPVQVETSSLVQECIFPKIYSFYSSLDFIQRIDPQGWYANKQKETPLFSQRIFPPCSKVNQAAIKFGSRGILHLEFLSQTFVQALPDVLKMLDTVAQTTSQPTTDKRVTISITPENRLIVLSQEAETSVIEDVD